MISNIEKAIKEAHLDEEMFEEYYDYVYEYYDDSELTPDFYVDYSYISYLD
jgi:hypothetical protein